MNSQICIGLISALIGFSFRNRRKSFKRTKGQKKNGDGVVFPTFEFAPIISEQPTKNRDKIAERREWRWGTESYDSDLMLSLGMRPLTVNKRETDSDCRRNDKDQVTETESCDRTVNIKRYMTGRTETVTEEKKFRMGGLRELRMG